jgi:acetylornithine/N-succinyldiaminopimelate aminotransferase
MGHDGEQYRDFGSGIAVNALSDAHPHLVKALTEQAARIWHTSNLYRVPEGERLAQRLVKYLEGFGPKVDGFDQVPFDDMQELEAAIRPETAALMIEPIQDESGLPPLPPSRMRQLRDLCERHGLLIFVYKVQTGVGRTGKWRQPRHSPVT